MNVSFLFRGDLLLRIDRGYGVHVHVWRDNYKVDLSGHFLQLTRRQFIMWVFVSISPIDRTCHSNFWRSKRWHFKTLIYVQTLWKEKRVFHLSSIGIRVNREILQGTLPVDTTNRANPFSSFQFHSSGNRAIKPLRQARSLNYCFCVTFLVFLTRRSSLTE